MRTLVIHLDESGDLTFSKNGTRYFVLTTIARIAPVSPFENLILLRDELSQDGMNIDYFHASEDRQMVRDRVFAIIQTGLKNIRIDSLIVEKCKTGPALQVPEEFYPRMLWYLLRWVMAETQFVGAKKVIFVTDRIPVQRKRKAVEKAIKERFAPLGKSGVEYEIQHQPSRDHLDLQVVDYCNWAIYRKWSMDDLRSYQLIKPSIRSEFDIFRTGTRNYY